MSKPSFTHLIGYGRINEKTYANQYIKTPSSIRPHGSTSNKSAIVRPMKYRVAGIKNIVNALWYPMLLIPKCLYTLGIFWYLMNTQINVRMSDELLNTAQKYAEKNGFGNVQELMKESLREKLFPSITKEELVLVKKLIQVTNKKGLWKSEEELFKALER